jgi:hypothetical protein
MQNAKMYIIPAAAIVALILIFAFAKKDEAAFKYTTPTSADNAPEGSLHNLPVPEAVAKVRAQVARNLNISEGQVIVMAAMEKEWPNACLGIQYSGEACAEVITPGYEVVVQANGKEFILRTNQSGSLIREEE